MARKGLPQSYLLADAEARRFLNRLDALDEKLRADEDNASMTLMIGCPESAAVKRASMDLTRALARLRKGGD